MSRKSRQSTLYRTLVLALFAAVLYILFVHPSQQSSTERQEQSEKLLASYYDLLANVEKAVPGGSAFARRKQQETAQKFLDRTNAASHHVKSNDVRGKEQLSGERSATTKIRSGDFVAFREALDQVLHISQNSHQNAELLEPFQAKSEAKIREIGLRSRAFSERFHALEAMHLVHPDEGDDILLRSDLVAMMYAARHAEEASQELAEKIRTVEAMGHLVRDLTGLLFPYIRQDLMALHTGFRGRGIVMTVGNRDAHFLMTTIPALRKLGCELPIEVMYLGDEDLSIENQQRLESLTGVVTRNLHPLIHNDGWTPAGWAVKAFAILLCSFREAILIDADSFFFVPPETLFANPGYTSTGALFFRDRRIFPDEERRPFLESLLPEPLSTNAEKSPYWTGESGHVQESGVVVLDKWRHFVALLVTTRMNGPDREGDEQTGDRGVDDMVFGDKETFWLGFELAGDVDYAFHTGHVGIIGSTPDAKQDVAKARDAVSRRHTICSTQLLHADERGRPIWFNGWIAENVFEGAHKLATLEAYMIEPEVATEPEPWEMQDDNVVCMQAERVLQFTEEERGVVEMIVETARANNEING